MSPALPLKEKVRTRIVELAQGLRPHFAQITPEWRSRMFHEFQLDGRVMAALERLNLGTGFAVFSHADFSLFFENLSYFGIRLGKLKVDTRVVARSLEIYQACCEPHVEELFPESPAEMLAALEMFSSAAFVTVSGAYFDAQRDSLSALLAVLDAELSAATVPLLLDQVLRISCKTFRAGVGVVLLRDDDGALRIQASVGLDGALDNDLTIPIGYGFSGQIAETGEAAILPDLSRSNGILNPALGTRARALWGVPLKLSKDFGAGATDQVIGVLIIGFERPYDWLPTERELLRAIADRSALAIERARITDTLREREVRIAELSGHLLRVQEAERNRISRELHDETGQALMVIRLYLGMLESGRLSGAARSKIAETVAVVDRTIDGIRRIIKRLSPLVLQELGLIAAIRKEAKDLSSNAGVKTRVVLSDEVGRLPLDCETAVYRVVQEALHNVAKHAQAKNASIHMMRENDVVHLVIEDDGQGMVPRNSASRTFGLAGMRERISMLGGTVKVRSSRGKGTRIEVTVPAGAAAEAHVMANSA